MAFNPGTVNFPKTATQVIVKYVGTDIRLPWSVNSVKLSGSTLDKLLWTLPDAQKDPDASGCFKATLTFDQSGLSSTDLLDQPLLNALQSGGSATLAFVINCGGQGRPLTVYMS